MKTKARKKHYSILLDDEMLGALRDIADRTRIPLQVIAREGISLVIEKHTTKAARRGAGTPRRA